MFLFIFFVIVVAKNVFISSNYDVTEFFCAVFAGKYYNRRNRNLPNLKRANFAVEICLANETL